MAYRMTQQDSNFFIPADKMDEAAKAILSLPIDYSLSNREFVNFKELKDIINSWGWSILTNASGDVCDILFDREAIGDEDVLFNTLAPFVKENSYIEMFGEDGNIWCWVFNGIDCQEIYPIISWGK